MKRIISSILVIVILVLFAIPIVFAVSQPGGEYNTGDIAVINSIISNNGLNWTPAPTDGSQIPNDWIGVGWDWIGDVRRVVSLGFMFSNLTGKLDVGGLTELSELVCGSNQLTSIDVSRNTALEDLEINYNQLASLDVSSNTALTGLGIESNLLTTLDIKNNTALKILGVAHNKLISLDVTGNTALEVLGAYGNPLTSLDVSKNTSLIILGFGDTQVTSIDLSKNTMLESLVCSESMLTSLNLNNNKRLIAVRCSNNQLTSLDVSRNNALRQLHVNGNYFASEDSVIGLSSTSIIKGLVLNEKQKLDGSIWTWLLQGPSYLFDPQKTPDDGWTPPPPPPAPPNVEYTQDGSFVTVTDNNIPKVDGRLVIDVSGVAGADTVLLSNNTLNQVRQIGLDVALPEGIISFSREAASNMISQGRGGGISMSVKSAKLTQAQAELVGNRPVFSLSVQDFNNNTISDFGANVTITLPYTLQQGADPNSVVVYYIDSNGTLKTIPNGRYNNGHVTFTTTHFSLYAIGYNPVTFNDISGHWAKSAIERAAANGLVSGYGDNKYKPEDPITRAGLVRMIYNVMLLPYEQTNEPIYTDVKPGEWYYPAIVAAFQAGFLDGFVDKGSDFMPNQDITRQEMALIFSNVVKEAGIGTVVKADMSTFSDLSSTGQKYVSAIETAINAGIFSTSGMGNGTFGALSNMTRAQAALVQLNLLEALARHE